MSNYSTSSYNSTGMSMCHHPSKVPGSPMPCFDYLQISIYRLGGLTKSPSQTPAKQEIGQMENLIESVDI